MSTQDPDAKWTLNAEQYALVEAEIAKNAPQVFAICEFERDEDGELAAGQVFAWGLKFADHSEVVSATHGFYGTFGSLNDSLGLLFSDPEEVRLAWPGTTSPHS